VKQGSLIKSKSGVNALGRTLANELLISRNIYKGESWLHLSGPDI
jgi:hypothetical protein